MRWKEVKHLLWIIMDSRPIFIPLISSKTLLDPAFSSNCFIAKMHDWRPFIMTSANNGIKV